MVLPPGESIYNGHVSARRCKTPFLESGPSVHKADRLHRLSCYSSTRERTYCFHRVLAIAILSLCLSVRLSHGWNEIGPRLDLGATLLLFVIQIENLVFVY